MEILKPILVAFLLATSAFSTDLYVDMSIDMATDVDLFDFGSDKCPGIEFLDTTQLSKGQCYKHFEDLMEAGVGYDDIQALSLNCTAILSYEEPVAVENFDVPKEAYKNYGPDRPELYGLFNAPPEKESLKRKNYYTIKPKQSPEKRIKIGPKTAVQEKVNNKNINKLEYPFKKPRVGNEYQVDLSSLAFVNEQETTQRGGTLIYEPKMGPVDCQSLAHEDAQRGKGLSYDAPEVKKYITQYLENNVVNERNKASSRAHAQILYNMSNFFEENKELSTADFYCEMSAELGNKEAQKKFELVRNNSKRSAQRDKKKAPKITPKKNNAIPKAKKLEGDGQDDLEWGIAYLYGSVDAKIDKEKAKICFEEAKRFGHKEACYWLAKYYEEKFHENPKEHYISQAVENYIIASKKGNAEAQYSLGLYFYNQYQKNLEKENLERAVFYYKLAAENNHANAQNELGILYEEGAGVDYSPEMAEKWYRRSAMQGLPSAQFNLGLCYEIGFYVKQNLAKATKYFKLAAAQGNIEAQKILIGRQS